MNTIHYFFIWYLPNKKVFQSIFILSNINTHAKITIPDKIMIIAIYEIDNYYRILLC